jgi:hypothetical protein
MTREVALGFESKKVRLNFLVMPQDRTHLVMLSFSFHHTIFFVSDILDSYVINI